MLLAASDENMYQEKRRAAYDFSKQFQWEKTGIKFEEFITSIQ